MSIGLSIDTRLLGSKDKDEDIREVQFETSGRTVGECLNNFLIDKPDVKKEFLDENEKLVCGITIFVNNSPFVVEALQKRVKNGDKIRVLGPLEGA